MSKLSWLLLLVALLAISCKETEKIYTPINTLTDPALMPEVIYTFPQRGATGPYEGFSTTLTVRFNKLMDAASLHHAVHFYSDAGDISPDTSILSINQGDVATISPVRGSLTVAPVLQPRVERCTQLIML